MERDVRTLIIIITIDTGKQTIPGDSATRTAKDEVVQQWWHKQVVKHRQGGHWVY